MTTAAPSLRGALTRGPSVRAAGALLASAVVAASAGAPPSPTAEETAPRAQVRDPLYQVPYNGRFTFTRVRYNSGGGSLRGWGRRGGWSNAWNHDYPDADRNLQNILAEFTGLDTNTDGSNVLDLENREIFRYPILYMSEPGYWRITREGAANLREHLLKGGMLIFDDFEANQWYNMADQVAQALPEAQWVEIDDTHPIFDSFFYVEDIYVPHPLVRVTPRYMAIFEDNDPEGRIMVLANHNSDLAEYWEYAATGYFPMDPTNDAFRLGVNYIIYGMTR